MTAAKHACLLLVGRHRGVNVALLVRKRGGERKLMVPGGLRETRQKRVESPDGIATAFREFAEEVLGESKLRAPACGRALRAKASSLRGPCGRHDNKHKAFVALATDLFDSIEAAYNAFRPNGEASAAVLVALDGLDGSETTVTDVYGSKHALRDRLGEQRLIAARELLRGPGRRLNEPAAGPSRGNLDLGKLARERESRRWKPY